MCVHISDLSLTLRPSGAPRFLHLSFPSCLKDSLHQSSWVALVGTNSLSVSSSENVSISLSLPKVSFVRHKFRVNSSLSNENQRHLPLVSDEKLVLLSVNHVTLSGRFPDFVYFRFPLVYRILIVAPWHGLLRA